MAPLTISAPSIPLSLASCSIGQPRHTLHQKLEAISQSGFTGIELSFPDLLTYAQELQSLGQLPDRPNPDADIQEDDYATLSSAASHARQLCATHNLSIIVLQPFANFEGWLDEDARKAVFDRARGWVRIMKAAGTDMLQVGSTDTPGHKITSSREKLSADLAELADLLKPEGFKIAYENWCWATHAPTWRDVWEVVKLTGRDNVGLCLDTFQSAGGEWGDPTTASGLLESESASALTSSWRKSLRALAREVPADKIYFLQISDAYKMEPPLAPHPEPNDDSGLRPRGRWSHDYRPLPYSGGYLPITDFARAVLETGFRGWFSVEVFDMEKWEDKYGDDLTGFAEEARESTRRLIEEAAGMEEL